MEEFINKINERIETHKSGVVNMEKKMIKIIQEGSKSCVNELTSLATHESLKSLKSTFSRSLIALDNEISILQEKLEKFDGLNISERLENSYSRVINETKEIPSLNPAAVLLEKLKASVDYKQAILNQKIF